MGGWGGMCVCVCVCLGVCLKTKRNQAKRVWVGVGGWVGGALGVCFGAVSFLSLRLESTNPPHNPEPHQPHRPQPSAAHTAPQSRLAEAARSHNSNSDAVNALESALQAARSQYQGALAEMQRADAAGSYSLRLLERLEAAYTGAVDQYEDLEKELVAAKWVGDYIHD